MNVIEVKGSKVKGSKVKGSEAKQREAKLREAKQSKGKEVRRSMMQSDLTGLEKDKEALFIEVLELTGRQACLIEDEEYDRLIEITDIKQMILQKIDLINKNMENIHDIHDNQAYNNLISEIHKKETENIKMLEASLSGLSSRINNARQQKNGYSAYFRSIAQKMELGRL